MSSESFDALFSDAGVELNQAKVAARRIVASFSDDLGETLSKVETQRELEGLLACLLSQLEKAAQSHERAELAQMRESRPPQEAPPTGRRAVYVETAAANVTDALRTLESIGYRLREEGSAEDSAVFSVVATLRDAETVLEHILSGRAAA